MGLVHVSLLICLDGQIYTNRIIIFHEYSNQILTIKYEAEILQYIVQNSDVKNYLLWKEREKQNNVCPEKFFVDMQCGIWYILSFLRNVGGISAFRLNNLVQKKKFGLKVGTIM